MNKLIGNVINILSSKQKYRGNAEPATATEEPNNDSSESAFDKLLEGEPNNEENNTEEAVAAPAAQPKIVKKKAVRLL